jgi:hypothetical protein
MNTTPFASEMNETRKPVSKPGVSLGLMSGGAGFTMTVSLSLILTIIFSYGAAKLSYDMFHSVGWSVLAFFFSGVYYPYYALFLNRPPGLSTPPPMGMTGARRR